MSTIAVMCLLLWLCSYYQTTRRLFVSVHRAVDTPRVCGSKVLDMLATLRA